MQMTGNHRLQQLLQHHNKIEPKDSALFIANSVDILVNIQRVKGKRKITEIAEIQGYDYTANEFKLKSVKGRENGDSIL